jgi:hypothetical protein
MIVIASKNSLWHCKPEIMWLKMLGDRESATEAFGSLEQLSSDRREKTDIIKTCKKYCVYLEGVPPELLSSEEKDIMRTLAEIDTWYETEMNQAVLKGEARGEERRNQAIAFEMLRENIPLETIVKITGLTTQQLAKLSSLTEWLTNRKSIATVEPDFLIKP